MPLNETNDHSKKRTTASLALATGSGSDLLTDLIAALADGAARHKDAVGHEALAAFWAMSSAEKLNTLLPDIARLNEDEKAGVVMALGAALQQPFIPLPGPQTMALESAADELLYGGAAGGSKSYLLLGAAATRHKRSLILRRQSTELDGLISDLTGMLGDNGFNKVDREHNIGGRSIKLGGMKEPDDWKGYAGRARDLMGFDEAGEFLEEQVASLIGWCRSTDPDQRCRIIFASNPPRGSEGQWLVEWFAPWLDPTFAGLAKPGELRWYIFPKNKTRWMEGPGRYEVEGEFYTAKSRTFIPAKLDDNPFLARTAYRTTLENLPEPLRSQLLKGDFLAGREDAAWQVIPSDWIQKARQRWTAERPHNRPMTSLGIDVAQGGPDRTTLAPRYGRWFGPLKVADGTATPDGLSVATLAFGVMRDGCTIVVDVGGGWGGDAYAHLKKQIDSDDAVIGYMGIRSTNERSVNGIEGFANIRAKDWWRFREALDPDTGADIALPPDPELAAELAMPRRVPEKKDILIESKEQIRKRLGRSPDKADAVIMAWAYGDARAEQRHMPMRLQTTANVGYSSAKQRLRARR